MMHDLTMTMEAVQKKMEDYCSALSNLGYLNGSILVAYQGNVLFSKGYGMANFEHSVSNTSQTVFRIGSITKQFTAAAILLLQELDLVNINDPISNCLPDYPNGEKITIHHLLTHSSGIPSFTSFIDYKKIMKHPLTLEEGVSKFKDLPLVFEPGEKYNYSNSGYLLLSYIIEKITNKSFESYLDESILNALGMKQTGHDNIKKLLKNRASGYEVWGEVVNAEYIDMSVPSGAGAMYSTVEDLFIWDQALHSEKLISHHSYGTMTTPHKDNYGYGLGIYEEEINNVTRKVIGHGGGINGFLSEYRRYVNEGLSVIVLSNMTTTQVGSIANSLARIALNEDIALPKAYTTIQMDLHQYESFVGDYQVNDEPNTNFTVSFQNGNLYITYESWFEFKIYPYSQDGETTSFFSKEVQGKVTFIDKELIVESFGGTKKATKV
jgi:CubicO group peptidase (beta-lactamase class C family)